eukprot:g70758.t1
MQQDLPEKEGKVRELEKTEGKVRELEKTVQKKEIHYHELGEECQQALHALAAAEAQSAEYKEEKNHLNTFLRRLADEFWAALEYTTRLLISCKEFCNQTEARVILTPTPRRPRDAAGRMAGPGQIEPNSRYHTTGLIWRI